MARRQQAIDDVAADESRAAGDENMHGDGFSSGRQSGQSPVGP
jgi:hypothetical protein